MITKLYIENVRLHSYKTASSYNVQKMELDFTNGVTYVPISTGSFFEHFINKFYPGNGLSHIETIDKEEVGYLIICCTYGDDIIKYISTYSDNKLFSETLLLGNSLIGHVDYIELKLDKGVIYWDTLGSPLPIDKIGECTLLNSTIAGETILNARNDYCFYEDGLKSQQYHYYLDSQLNVLSYSDLIYKLNLGNENRIDDINELLPCFGFNDVRIDKQKYVVYHKNCKNPLQLEEEGSGFKYLVGLLSTILWAEKHKRILVIPNYGRTLHVLVKKRLEEFLKHLKINVIVTDWI